MTEPVVKDITIPSLPWESDRQVSEPKDFNSPGDFLQQASNFQFQVTATRIIFSNLTKENAYIPDEISMSHGDNFAQLLRLVAHLSQNYPESILSSLLTWRFTMNPFSEFSAADLIKSQKTTSKTSKQDTKDKSVYKRGPEELAQDERQGIIVDYIFVQLVTRVLRFYDGQNITDKTADALEIAIFKFIINTTISKNPAAIRNREYVLGKFKEILGQLAKFRIYPIMVKFFEKYEANIKQPLVLASLVDGMEYVSVNSELPSEVKDACRVFTIISRNLRAWFIKPKKTEQKYALCGLVGTIFAPLAAAPLVTDADSRSHAQSLYELCEVNMKKSKNSQLLPITVCTLCISSAQIFHEKFDMLVESLLSLPKESILRTHNLESLYTLLFASMTKYDDKNEGRRQRVRGSIAAHLYPMGKKTSFSTELEHIDIIVDIIELLSVHDIESVVASIVIPFLQVAQPPIPEQIIIGFVALMKIYHQVSNDKIDSLYITPLMLPFFSQPRCAFRKRTLTHIIEANEKQSSKVGEAHIKQAANCAASVLATFHPQVASFSKLQGHMDIDTLPRDKLFQIFAVEAAVSSIFACIPSSIHCMELLGYLSQYTIHNYIGLAQVATSILRHIATTRPSFRSALIHAFARFSRLAPDAEPQLMSKNAENFLELLRIWYHQIHCDLDVPEQPYEFENTSELESPNFPQIESLGLLYMCSPHSHTRTIGYEIIRTSTVLHDHCSQTLGDVTESIYSRVLEKAPRIIQRSYLEPYYVKNNFELSDLPSTVPTLDHLVTLSQNEKDGQFNTLQQRWSRVLAGMLQRVTETSPETAKEFWKCARERILPVYQIMETMRSENNNLFEEYVILWNNYIHCTVGCSAVNDMSIFEATNDKIIQSARDLYKHIIPAMRSDATIIAISAKDAISFLPALCVESFLTELGPYHKLAFSEEKVKGRIRQQNAVLLSYAYRVISMNRMDGYLHREKGTLTHYLSYIQQQLDRIPDIAGVNDNIMDILYWRYHLCLTIENIYNDLIHHDASSCRSMLGESLFQKLMEFLTLCSGYSNNTNSLSERQKNKERRLCQSGTSMMTEYESAAEAVQVAASKALAILCFGSCHGEEENQKFIWISNVFASGQSAVQPIAQRALINLLRSNRERKEELFKRTVDLCYSSDHKIASWTFYTLVDMYINGNIPIYPHVLLCLALHKMGDSIERVRQDSVSLMTSLSETYFPGDYPLVQNTGVFDCYYHSQLQVALRVSELHPAVSLALVEEAFHRFRIIDGPARERLVHIIAPFLSHIDLTNELDHNGCCGFLERLLVLTMKYGEEFTFSVQASWRNLAHSRENVNRILNYLISLCCNRRAKSLLLISCKVALIVARSAAKETIEKLVYELFDTTKVGVHWSDQEYHENSEQNMETQALMVSSWAKDFVFMFPSLLHQVPFSRSNIAMILLCDLIVENFAIVQEHLHLIFIVALLAQDASSPWVIKYGKTTLANILFAALGSKQYQALPEWVQPLTKDVDVLKAVGLWNKSDFICRDGTLETQENYLRKFVVGFLKAIEGVCPEIQGRVAMSALRWAKQSSSAHYICRSLQVYRYLKQPLRADAFSCIVYCIHRHIEQREASGSRDVMFEALTTLHSVAGYSSASEILQVPQLLWVTLSCLQTDCEEEYWLSIDLLAVLLQQIDFDDEALKVTLRSKPPGDWVVPFAGIQPLILKGFASRRVESCARALVSEFLTIDCPELIDSSSTRYLDNILVLLPYLMENIITTNEEDQQETLRIAKNIWSVCQDHQWPEMGRIFQMYMQGEFDDGNVFMKQLAAPFFRTLVNGHELRTLSLLRCYICYAPKYQKRWMQVFVSVLEQVEMEKSPVRYQAFAIFHNLLTLIAADNWELLFSIFNTAVQSSKALETYQFSMLPNPSVVARILDRFETKGSPWTFMDQEKHFMISTMSEILTKLEKESPNVSDRSSDALLDKKMPDVDPFIPHYSPVTMESGEVIEPTGMISFASDDLVKELQRPAAVYEAPPKPIEIAEPSSEIPASPMLLRKQATTPFSPRGPTTGFKKRFIK